jgi:hypothetical protein
MTDYAGWTVIALMAEYSRLRDQALRHGVNLDHLTDPMSTELDRRLGTYPVSIPRRAHAGDPVPGTTGRRRR